MKNNGCWFIVVTTNMWLVMFNAGFWSLQMNAVDSAMTRVSLTYPSHREI